MLNHEKDLKTSYFDDNLDYSWIDRNNKDFNINFIFIYYDT